MRVRKRGRKRRRRRENERKKKEEGENLSCMLCIWNLTNTFMAVTIIFNSLYPSFIKKGK